ncbi:MAG: hypothetical protein AAF674_22405 [Pseudomonadota bacterium]
MQSVFRSPWEVSRSLLDNGFAHFLRAPWQPAWVKDCPDGRVEEEPIPADMHPETGAPFGNICQMRNAKIAHYETLANLPCQVIFVRYEMINRDPKAVLGALAQAFDLSPPLHLREVVSYKGDRKARYRPKPQAPFSIEDLSFVWTTLDIEQEDRIGYQIERIDARDGLRWYDRKYLMALLRRYS